jgi:hypothetical protein
VGTFALVINILFHLERIPAPAGAALGKNYKENAGM